MSCPVLAPRMKSLSEFHLKLSRPVTNISQTNIVGSRKWYQSKGNIPTRKTLERDAQLLEEMEEEFQTRSEAAYKYGFSDGKDIGVEEGRAEVKPVIDALHRMIAEYDDKREHLFREANELVLRLTISISEKIIRKEISLDPMRIQQLVQDSLKMVDDRQKVTVRVASSDWQAIKDSEEDLLRAAHGIRGMEIREDDSLEPGDCIVESNAGLIDSRIRTQLDELSETLLKEI